MKVLLAHDASPGADEATALVAGTAWPAGSTIRVISAVEPMMVGLTAWGAGAGGYSENIDLQIKEYYEEQLAEAVRRLDAPDRSVESAVIRGRPATFIVDEARAFGADLVVVGSRGRGGVASLVLGSVSSEVVDHAPCPVLVARTASVAGVLFATDGSPSATAAQGLILDWPLFKGHPVTVVSVADVPQPLHTGIAPTMVAQAIEAYAEERKAAQAEHDRIANDSAAALRAGGLDASAVTRVGDAAAEVIAAAQDAGADLIILGSRGRTGLTRLLLGSVARNVLHGSTASVLVVREGTTHD